MNQDPHSFYQPGQPRITHTAWSIGFDFDTKRVHGHARHTFDTQGNTTLDTRDLEIQAVTDASGSPIPFTLADAHPVKGSALSFVAPDDKLVDIEYRTSPTASGIQWMSAELAGGKPFVYTQGEAINARSYIPCQDTPSVKFTFEASVSVPEGLRGLIAASEHKGQSEAVDGMRVETWAMPFPITAYLIAFAVGDLASMDISDRSRAWALPAMVAKVAAEFEDLPQLMEAGETLFGPYPFGRYDVLVLPPAFPYGGMENPCLSFLTPALIAGDKSGLTTVAHELAHSWTGNLVTNADWDSFWLNEGWTVYAEYRIGEAVFGTDEAMLHLKLLEREFDTDVARFMQNDEAALTKLAPGVTDVDPDEIFSRVPYFKGAQFLRQLESIVGRERFDPFIRDYMDAHKYQSITTAEFLAYAGEKLGRDVLETAHADAWVYGPGIPANAPAIVSPQIEAVEECVSSGEVPLADIGWSTPQFQLYLELLPRPALRKLVAALDERFKLSGSLNTEVRWSFLVLAVQSGYEMQEQVEAFLRTQGRMKYLKPLYEALVATDTGRAFAERVFADARASYHPVAIATIERVFARAL